MSYLVAVLAKGTSLLAGLAGFECTQVGAATGGSTVSGIEGTGLLVATATTEGDGGAASDICLATTGSGEADGVSPEMDCDTACVFSAEGNTMPDTPGSAAAVATYEMLHLVAAARGGSIIVAQVYSPIDASGLCQGGGSAEYVSIQIYVAESVEGDSEAVGAVGGIFHALAQCSPIMASYAWALRITELLESTETCWGAAARQRWLRRKSRKFPRGDDRMIEQHHWKARTQGGDECRKI
jgi:hypothetical protein